MTKTRTDQWTIELNLHLESWLEAFLVDRRAQNLASGTLYFYRAKIKVLLAFCDTQAITRIDQLNAVEIRNYLLWLKDKGHNPGGVHACYRVLKTFLLWFENETDNPVSIGKVKPPRIDIEPLEPLSLDNFDKLLAMCKGDYHGIRDRAILLSLLDTGCRASEFCAINLEDVNQINGAVVIRRGKGGKPRSVFFGKITRKAVRDYLKVRRGNNPGLWLTEQGERLTYWGLEGMVKRRSKQAGIDAPSLHSFRRTFALNMLRAGADVYSIQSLMGHSDLQVLRRYLKQVDSDLQEAHARFSPVDRLRKN